MAAGTTARDGGTVRRWRILHVDDHPITCAAMAQLLELEPDMVVCPPAHDAPAALESIARLNPDILIADLSLPGVSGLELIEEISARFPKLPILVFSTHDESLYAERALRAGARGYLMKDAPPEEVVVALRQIMGGRPYLSQQMTEALLGRVSAGGGSDISDSPVARLTPRELEIFRLIGQGSTTRQVAAALSLSPKTVEGHSSKIKEKLGLHNSVQLQQRAALWVKGMPLEEPGEAHPE